MKTCTHCARTLSYTDRHGGCPFCGLDSVVEREEPGGHVHGERDAVVHDGSGTPYRIHFNFSRDAGTTYTVVGPSHRDDADADPADGECDEAAPVLKEDVGEWARWGLPTRRRAARRAREAAPVASGVVLEFTDQVQPVAIFELGDVVRLRSGGPPMTVVAREYDFGKDGGAVGCSWFVGNTLHSKGYAPSLLELTKPADPAVVAIGTIGGQRIHAEAMIECDPVTGHLIASNDPARALYCAATDLPPWSYVTVDADGYARPA